MIGLRLEIGYGGAQPLAYNPAAQFAAGGLGAWYDPSDYATLSQDSAGATPVTAVGQTVGRMLDKSGRGNALSQATAASRPITSARVNLLQKSEQFDDVYWSKSSVTVTANSTVAPDGTTTADTLTATAGGGFVQRDLTVPGGQNSVVSVNILKTSGATTYPMVVFNGLTGITTYAQVFLNTNTGVATARGEGLLPGAANIVVQNAGAFWKLSFSLLTGAANTVLQTLIYPAFSSDGTTANGTLTGSCVAWGIQAEPGTVATRHQRVNTASDYDAVGFPQYHTLDGVDDGGATGAITLSADMDYFIAVRRNSAADSILSAITGSAGAYIFCMSSSAGPVSASAGTPTYAANGVDVPGGTGTTRVQLQTAVTQSQWIVVEARNANFSGWTSIGISNYVSGFAFNGDVGGAILAPAGDATARQKNRQFLGAKVGLSLP